MSGKYFDLSDVNQAIWDDAFKPDPTLLYPPLVDPRHEHKQGDDRVFVFGSNTLGIHGAGAAAYAHRKLGAEIGVGEGPTGRTYALPTCYQPGEPVTLQELAVYIDNFFSYAKLNPQQRFFVSKVGCGIAGFDENDVAYIFHELGVPDNCDIPPDWMYTNDGVE